MVPHPKIDLQLMFPDQTRSFRQVLFEVCSSHPKAPAAFHPWALCSPGSKLWWGSVCVRVLSYALHESGWVGKCRRAAIMCATKVHRQSGGYMCVNATWKFVRLLVCEQATWVLPDGSREEKAKGRNEGFILAESLCRHWKTACCLA